MLLEFVSAESIKTEDVIDILQTGMYQIDSIEHFTENIIITYCTIITTTKQTA